MQAIICETFDDPGQLKVSEIDEPAPAAREVLVSVKAVGLGYVDALTVAGKYQIKPTLPFIPGNEISGVVEKLGEGVKHLRLGQRVLAMPTSGGLAEKVCIADKKCTVIPEILDHTGAAGFQVNYCTAYHGLTHCGNLNAKETILILGASGGVGVAAIDVAKAIGATVIAAAGSSEKRDACLQHGADHVIDYSKDNWRDQLKEILNGTPLNVIYDPVGGPYAEPALRSLAPEGRYLVVGFAAGDIPKIPLNLALLKQIQIIGVNWGGYIAVNPTKTRPVLTKLLEWIASGKLKPKAGECFSLQQAGTAMMKMLDRKAIGKIVITMEA
ncbi:MAG: NADPH:quinone oxidoreductase family protein [Pseudomonadales bacterium]|nr:NADPH:quinone oxidoreductase family protein [Pseudomonadales bacterium]